MIEEDARERERESVRERDERYEDEFIAPARLHARKFDKDEVWGEKRGVLNEVEARIMRDERVRQRSDLWTEY